jgi:hypothetical protein
MEPSSEPAVRSLLVRWSSAVLRRSTGALLASLFLSATSAAAAPAGGDAQSSGKWVVDGKTVELRHARAFREPDPFGKGTNPCVLVSSEPVPDAAVPDDDEGIAELLDLMRSGALRALQVCFDANGTKLRNVNDVFTFHPDVSPGRFAFQGHHQFIAKPAPGRIAGKLTGSGDTNSGGKWSVDVELSAPMPE